MCVAGRMKTMMTHRAFNHHYVRQYRTVVIVIILKIIQIMKVIESIEVKVNTIVVMMMMMMMMMIHWITSNDASFGLPTEGENEWQRGQERKGKGAAAGLT